MIAELICSSLRDKNGLNECCILHYVVIVNRIIFFLLQYQLFFLACDNPIMLTFCDSHHDKIIIILVI